MANAFLLAMAPARRKGQVHGIASVCSAHPVVIGAALALGKKAGGLVLIEATCNQVNQDGGYTGMKPADFSAFVRGIAQNEGFDTANLILGGDHLGPNPWTHLPAAQAMEKAKVMVASYVRAGFGKIHLDASMSCADDPSPLPAAIIAARNASLAAVAEAQAMLVQPVYIIGTEVPVPGGALEVVDHLTVTTPEDAAETVALHEAAFAAEGIAAAFTRVVGLVVQPGVEFGHENVAAYDAAAASALCQSLTDLPMLFEAHSTDYQTGDALRKMVQDGFGILKVGPGLTFALREALYALDHITELLRPGRALTLQATMEKLMLQRPKYWEKYYSGDADHQRLQRHFSYSDRIRYYWADPVADAAVSEMFARLGGVEIPETLVSQYFGLAYGDVMEGNVAPTPSALLRDAVTRVLSVYQAACAL